MKLPLSILLAVLLGAGPCLANSVTVIVVNLSGCNAYQITVVAGISEGGSFDGNVIGAPGGIFTVYPGQILPIVCTAPSYGPTLAWNWSCNGVTYQTNQICYLGANDVCPPGSVVNPPSTPLPPDTSRASQLILLNYRKTTAGGKTNTVGLFRVRSKIP